MYHFDHHTEDEEMRSKMILTNLILQYNAETQCRDDGKNHLLLANSEENVRELIYFQPA